MSLQASICSFDIPANFPFTSSTGSSSSLSCQNALSLSNSTISLLSRFISALGWYILAIPQPLGISPNGFNNENKYISLSTSVLHPFKLAPISSINKSPASIIASSLKDSIFSKISL